MTNILLTSLNAKFIHTNLALRYIYEMAKKYHNKIEIKEFTINNEENYIFSEIMEGQYDIICFSCYIWNITKILQLTANIKKINKDAIIILGGQEVSYDSEKLIKDNAQIDYIIRGEGEKTFVQLLDDLVDKKGMVKEIKGITYRTKEGVRSNKDQKLIQNLDEIAFPYQNYFPSENRIIYYETSRGCPYQCSYCMSSVTKDVRYFSVERVKKDISFFLNNNVQQVKFVDRTFNADIKRCMAIMEFICENDNGKTNFHFEMNGDGFNEEMLDFLKNVRKGFFQFEIGVQSTHLKTIKAINRKTNFQKIADNVKKLHGYGNIHLHLDLIAGLPYEDYKIFLGSFNQVYGLRPHALQLGFLKLLKGAKIREEADLHGYVFKEQEPYEILSNEYLSYRDLTSLKKIEDILDKYYNRPGFQATLKYMTENYNHPSDFYEALSAYYYNNGYHHESHSKKALYEILKDFCIEKGASASLIDELLLYDKMSVSQIGQRDASNHFHKAIHNILHNEKFRSKYMQEHHQLKVKQMKKKISFQIFEYNVYDYAKSGHNLKRSKNLCIFDYSIKEINGISNVSCLDWIMFEEYCNSRHTD